MGYKCYLVEASQAGDDWILKMALTKKSDNYAGIILVTSNEAPDVTVGTRVMMYGRCVGMSVPSDETTDTGATAATAESYPCFELLLMTSL
jgi:hypothetical protein